MHHLISCYNNLNIRKIISSLTAEENKVFKEVKI